jgi:hypothetical protein
MAGSCDLHILDWLGTTRLNLCFFARYKICTKLLTNPHVIARKYQQKKMTRILTLRRNAAYAMQDIAYLYLALIAITKRMYVDVTISVVGAGFNSATFTATTIVNPRAKLITTKQHLLNVCLTTHNPIRAPEDQLHFHAPVAHARVKYQWILQHMYCSTSDKLL